MAKQVKTMADVQAAINDLYNRQELLRTKDWDFKRLRIKNASDGVDPQDYVTVAQLPSLSSGPNVDNDYYAIVWSKDGTVVTAEKSPPYVVGIGRPGQVIQVWLGVVDEPVSGNLTINIELNTINPVDSSVRSSNILSTDLSMPQNTTAPVFSSKFVTPTPTLGEGMWLNKVIVNGAGAAYVSIGLVIKTIGNNNSGKGTS